MSVLLDTIALEMFIAVAQTRSFTFAAKIVGRTQPAVSLQIKKLEEEFCTKFFQKLGTKLILTQDGEIFLSYAISIINSQIELQSLLKEKKTKYSCLKIAIPEDIATIYLPDILKSFHKLHPDIDLEICCDLTLNILQNFDRNYYDVAIVKDDHGLINANCARPMEIWTEPLIWVASKDYIIKDKLSLIVSPDPCLYRSNAIRVLSENNIKWKIQYTTHSIAGKLAALDASFGVCALSANILVQNKSLQNVGQKFNLPELAHFKILMLKNRRSESGVVDIFCKHIMDRVCML
jgi:DNA-binding transcriptional LysR family regulator